MSTLTLKVEPNPGADISIAFRKAIHIAKKLDVTVEFEFNTVICFSNRYSKVDIGVESYHRAIETNQTYAFSYPRQYQTDTWFEKSRNTLVVIVVTLVALLIIFTFML